MALVIEDEKKYKIRLLQQPDQTESVVEVSGRQAKELMLLGRAVLVFDQNQVQSELVEKR